MRLCTGVIWLVAVVLSSYWLLARLLDYEQMFTLLDALGNSVSLGIMVAYAPALVMAVWRQEKLRSGHILILGVCMTWLANAGRMDYHWYWRWLGQPVEMLNTYAYGFFVWVTVVGGFLHFLAYGAIEEGLPRRWWVTLGALVATTVALVFAGLIIWHGGVR
jgi:hypothetical protein